MPFFPKKKGGYCILWYFALDLFNYNDNTGLEEVMEFLQQSFPDVTIAIAHGKVLMHLSQIGMWGVCPD